MSGIQYGLRLLYADGDLFGTLAAVWGTVLTVLALEEAVVTGDAEIADGIWFTALVPPTVATFIAVAHLIEWLLSGIRRR